MTIAVFLKGLRLHEPTPAEIKSGDYAKREIPWRGLTIAVENEQGSVRRGRDRDGKAWEQRMTAPYGEIQGTQGVDGDPVDVFVGPDLEAPTVYVVHARKVNRWDEYDEDKCMVGYADAAAARQAFLDNYSDPRFFGDMTAMPVAEFLTKVKATAKTPAMIKAEQLSLFDEPVLVQAAVKKDGTVVKPYTRVQKKAHKAPATAREKAADREAAREAGRKEIEAAKTWEPKALTLDEEVERGAKNLAAFKRKAAAVRKFDRENPDYHEKKWREAHPVIPDHPYLTGKPRPEQPLELKLGPKLESRPPKPSRPRKVLAKHPDEPHAFGAQGMSVAKRRKVNAEVVALLAAEKTEYTRADKALMAKYSGNGGCGDSLNEFYTDPAVAAAMWKALGRMGFTTGTALEPSCGTGVFLQTAPPGVKVTGVEIESVSARVAKALHANTHEIQQASLEVFANNDDRRFDVVIGNAPFGDRGATVRDDKPDVARADCYFVDTALDKAAPGGLVAMIVNHGTLDTVRDEAMRARFASKGQFLGAMRMPNTAFEHSHTDVTADILFFRKYPDDVAGALGTLNRKQLLAVGAVDADYLAGNYFDAAGRANVLGAVEPGWRAKAGMGNDITVTGSMQGVPDAIAGFEPAAVTPIDMPAILAYIDAEGDAGARRRALGAGLTRAYEKKTRGDTKTVDGVKYILEGEPLRWHRVDEFMAQQSIVDAGPIAAEIDKLVTGQPVSRPWLEAVIRDYVAKHGLPSKNKLLEQAAHQDHTLYRLIGAVKPDGTLSNAVLGKTATKHVASLDTAAQILAAEHEDGIFTAAEVSARSDKDVEQAEDAMMANPAYAYVGGGKWTTMENYLAGELWPKLDALKAAVAAGNLEPGVAEKYALQERRLDEVIAPMSLDDVQVAVNDGFVPLDVVAAYFNDMNQNAASDYFRKQPAVTIELRAGLFHIGGGYFSDRQLLDKYLNRHGVKEDEQPAIDEMNRKFKAWLLGSRFRESIEDAYNRRFRGFVQRHFSDKPFFVPGLNTEGLKSHQYSGVRWDLANKRGIIADDVGMGKTVHGLMLARMAKINGQAKRPVIVVPKSVLSNWAREAEKWFPGSKVLVIGESINASGKPETDSASERNRKLHDMTQNEYDFVFISQPAWQTIDINPDLKERYAQDDFWAQRAASQGKEPKKKSEKQERAEMMRHEQNVAAADFQVRTDAADFDKLGIDMLIMDEAHAYKNLFGPRNRFGEKPKFLGGGSASKRSQDMSYKARWVREKNDGNNVYFLTATPSKNSPLEIYSMLSYIAPDSFERLGIRNSEEFIDRFCEFKTGTILGMDGTIQDALYTSGFKNMDELREVMRRNIKRRTADQVGLKMPAREDFEHVMPMTAEQAKVYETLRDAVKNADSAAGGESHIFSIMDKMGKAALDLELLDPSAHAGAVSPKINEAARIAAENSKDGGQIIFCERIESHDKIKAALIAAGVKPEQIVIFNGQTAPSSEARQKIQDDFNAGRTKVVIGNKTMEEGVNLQKFTTDIHHLDTPWEPATLQQRNGRGLRQGNTHAGVRIHSYHAAGTFDGYRYQTVIAKKDWQQLLWNGGKRIENLATPNVPSREEMLIMLSTDPDAERAKMAGNKALAEASYKAQKTEEASADFGRYQSMKGSLAALKNKDSDAARRLTRNIGVLHAKLKASNHFPHKEALDSATPVLIHPSTGAIVTAGTGVKIGGDSYVVTAVDHGEGEVTLRRYAQVAGGGTRTVKLEDLGKDSTVFAHDQAAEDAEVQRQVDADAGAKLEAAEGLSEVVKLHPSIIAKHYARLQERLHANARDYKGSFHSYGKIAMIHPAGHLVAAETHEHRKLQDHDYVLPTPEHRAKMLAAYADAERGKRFATKVDTYGGRRGQMTHKTSDFMETRYDKHSDTSNPFGRAGKEVFGDDFEREAHDAFEAEQHGKMQSAASFEDALTAAAPTITTDYSGHTWPKKTLAILFAAAKNTGSLGRSFAEMMPKGPETYGYRGDLLDRRLFGVKSGGYGSTENVRDMPVSDALQKMAESGGYYDLAAAIAVQANPPAVALSKLVDLPLTQPSVVDGIAHVVEKHPEIASKKASEFMSSYAIRDKLGHGYETMTMGEVPEALRAKEAA